MKIIISPAKKMMEDTDTITGREMPVFLKWIRALSYVDAQKLWDCGDKIAEENYRRFQNMDLDWSGYSFREDLSTEQEYVFAK